MKRVIFVILLTQLLVAKEDTVVNCNSIFSTIQRVFLDKEQAEAHNDEGLELYNKDNSQEAIEKYIKGLSSINENKCLEVTAHLYHNLALAYDDLEEYKKAIYYYKKAIEVKKNVFPDNRCCFTETYDAIAASYRSVAEYDNADKYYKLAKISCLASLSVDKDLLADIYADMGENYRLSDDLNKSYIYNKKAIDILEKIDLKSSSLAMPYNNMGLVYDDENNKTEAIKYYKKSIELKDKNSYDAAITYINIAVSYGDLEQYDLSIKYYKKAEAILTKYLNGNSIVLYVLYNNMGYFYEDQGKLNKALELFRKAYKGGKKILGESHPHIETFKENMQRVRKKLHLNTTDD